MKMRIRKAKFAVFMLWPCVACSPCVALAQPAQQNPQANAYQWQDGPPLPVAVSGHFAGSSRGALITVGGAHFPIPLFEGGAKEWVGTVQVLPPKARFWMTFGSLAGPLAYGATVSDDTGLICLGGGDAQTHTSQVFRLEWTGNALVKRALPPLPKACAFMGAALVGNWLYVVGGQETPASTTAFNSLWGLNLKQKNARWRELMPLPGPGRILPVVAAQGNWLYVFSGASLAPNAEGKAVRTYVRDGWRFHPETGWKAVAPPPWAVVAAPAAPQGNDQILVFGGSDGALDARVQELKENHPGFHREVLSYDTRRDSWQIVSTLPLSLVTTNAVTLGRDIVIPGGEDRPGHRSPRVLRYTPEK